MHSYLKAIGYSKIANRAAAESLITHAVEVAHERRICHLSDTTALMEASYDCAPGIGITVRGELDTEQEEGVSRNFHLEHYFPYYRGTNVSLQEDIYISKRVDTEAYNGMCDDSRIGISLIFYLQNAVDYVDFKNKGGTALSHPVTLSALSLEGKVLLPVAKTALELRDSNAKSRKRSHLVAEAKKGNQEAIESLTMEDLDLYSMIGMRSKNEDLYSIVDTTFIPFGAESDVYTVLGHIEAVKSIINEETKEELWGMQISCNGLTFDLCINKNDLLGEPAVGRRFSGTVWMQGQIDFM